MSPAGSPTTSPDLSPAAGASRLLRLLFDDGSPGHRLSAATWQELLPVARRSGVLLRAVERLDPAVPLPAEVATAVTAERRGATASVALVRRVVRECASRDVPHVFISALQHLPDVGLDVDLLVPEDAPRLDAALDAALGSRPLARGLGARLSGAVTYPSADALPLDVHRGRLGVAGEHVRFPAALLAAPRTTLLGTVPVPVPTADDQMVLQGMHRVYGRRHIRLGDLATTVASIGRDRLDWDYIVARSAETGTMDGLSCYLRYVDAIHREVLGRPLLDPRLADRLGRRQWGAVSLQGGVLRFPVLRVNGRLFPQALARQLRTQNWPAAARLCLVPAVMAESSLRRLARRGGLIASPQGA
jgi:hypothetical protein